MKLKEFFYLLGLRPRGVKTYGYRIQKITLPQDGVIEYARWLHPKQIDLILDPQEMNELRKFINEGDLAIDIGAQVGDTTLPMALACGKSGLVLALEPNPYTRRILEANARLNKDKTNIEVLPFAATETEGEFTFEYNDSAFCNGGDLSGVSRWLHGSAFALTVEGKRLSKTLRDCYSDRLPRLKYIKVDVEGKDLYVLSTVRDIIVEFKPAIKIEVYKFLGADARRDIWRFFEELDYTLYKINGLTLRGEKLSSADDLSRWQHFDVFAVNR